MTKVKQKKYTTTAVIDGQEQEVTFTFQHPGSVKAVAEFMEETANQGVGRTDRMLKEIIMGENLETLKWEHFDQYENGYILLQELTVAATYFLVGANKKE